MTRFNASDPSASLLVVSVRSGLPQVVGMPEGIPPFESAILKAARVGAVLFEKGGVEGDRQADLKNHGGPDNAVCVYPGEHYPKWALELGPGRTDLGAGAFGENLTVEGHTESTVSIGDRFTAPSGLVLQVTQPRVPCRKLARRWDVPDMPKRVLATGRTGWYCRVVNPGTLEQGELLERTQRPHPEWTVERASQVYQSVGDHPVQALELAEVPPLSAATRASLYRRLHGGGYIPMACAVHDLLEDAAVRRVPLDLELVLPTGGAEIHTALIKDLRTEEGAEYVELASARLVRLDRIASVRPTAPKSE